MFFDIVLNMQRYDFFLKYKKSFQKTTFEARMPPSTLRTRVPSGWKVYRSALALYGLLQM